MAEEAAFVPDVIYTAYLAMGARWPQLRGPLAIAVGAGLAERGGPDALAPDALAPDALALDAVVPEPLDQVAAVRAARLSASQIARAARLTDRLHWHYGVEAPFAVGAPAIRREWARSLSLLDDLAGACREVAPTAALSGFPIAARVLLGARDLSRLFVASQAAPRARRRLIEAGGETLSTVRRHYGIHADPLREPGRCGMATLAAARREIAVTLAGHVDDRVAALLAFAWNAEPAVPAGRAAWPGGSR